MCAIKLCDVTSLSDLSRENKHQHFLRLRLLLGYREVGGTSLLYASNQFHIKLRSCGFHATLPHVPSRPTSKTPNASSSLSPEEQIGHCPIRLPLQQSPTTCQQLTNQDKESISLNEGLFRTMQNKTISISLLIINSL